MKPQNHIGKLILLLFLALPVAAHAQTTAKEFCDRASAKMDKGDADGAIACCNRAIELDAKNANAYAIRARAEDIKSDFDAATADSNHAIDFDSRIAVAYRIPGTRMFE